MNNLKGKVAIVTGGGRDIGSQVSILLAQAGAKVCFNYFGSDDQANQTKKTIEDAQGEVIAFQGDMTNAEEVQKMVSTCVEHFGEQIDIVVNVVGGLVARKTIEEMDEEFWDFVMDVNLKSAFLVSKYAVPFMSKGGSIVNFSSQAARDGGGPGAIAYATAKGAVLTFTRGLAKELGPKGIRVNAVSPGMIATTFHDTFTKSEVREKVAGMTPLRREGQAAEVAQLVLFLASSDASFVTGSSMEINGGTYFI
ncbi:3-oxoacyl-[acyl-carrier protein] reductase [Dyadobacter jejuensis]|uniref:3-oxoacyl-[acyl-carrier protein] reductase n=1 Tax=Dyadobacter jejuensis TaxID=1082580 RepID=A0A316B773_9BACT|nr:glucose 1-dehydrogenase [Dyadobacter jejuensis]PWJ58457.1 3-oxoacyl-[acyl-carrier protein] reductase [Dyadobacter jejuensis]